MTTRNQQRRSRNHTKVSLLLALAGLLLLIVWLGLKGWRIYQAAVSLQTRQDEAAQLMADGLAHLDPEAMEALVTGLRTDVVTLRQELRIFMPLMPYLGWVPQLGPSLVAAPHLLQIADAASASAAYAFRGLKPGLALLQQSSSDSSNLLAALLPVLQQATPDLNQAALELDRAAAAYARLDNGDALPWRLRQFFPLLDKWLPVAQGGMKLAQSLPALLGNDGPRSYLVIAQNENELRPTGGFISGVGLLTLQNGQIASLKFDDANVVDDWVHKPYDWPPDPLYQYMGSELFLFRDANFWPDFPTSATSMMDLYTYGQGVPLDGVVATDQQFLQMLLSAIGPITLPELNETVSGSNVLAWIKLAWQPSATDQDLRTWMLSRKSFMGPLAAAIQAKILGNPGNIDLANLGRTMMSAVASKHLLIYLRDPSVAGALAEMGWDGRLSATPGEDVLLLADTNMGFNKANAVVDTGMRYDVTITPAGSGTGMLTVTYTHNGAADNADCVHQTVYTVDTTYEQLTNDCYWNYARVYTPAGAALLAGTSEPIAATYFVSQRAWDGQVKTVTDPGGLATFANFLLLRRGESATQQYTYQLPAVIETQADGTRRYQLRWIKQPGTRPQPVAVRVTLPPDAQLIATEPENGQVNGQTVTFVASLTTDMTFALVYR